MLVILRHRGVNDDDLVHCQSAECESSARRFLKARQSIGNLRCDTRSCRQHGLAATPMRCSVESDVKVKVGRGPRNSRFVFASLDVRAPIEVLWTSLTDYDHLDEFIPSLAENECLQRRPTGAILRQAQLLSVYIPVL